MVVASLPVAPLLVWRSSPLLVVVPPLLVVVPPLLVVVPPLLAVLSLLLAASSLPAARGGPFVSAPLAVLASTRGESVVLLG